jgi:hypothetical protein
MNEQMAFNMIQFGFAGALCWSCFCRLVKTGDHTEREIRLAIWLEFVAGALLMGAPDLPAMVPQLYGTGPFQWMPGTTPAWIYLLSVIAATLMQVATAKFWRDGPPRDFRRMSTWL